MEGGGTDGRCGDPLWQALKEVGTLISGPRKDVLKLCLSPLGTASGLSGCLVFGQAIASGKLCG